MQRPAETASGRVLDAFCENLIEDKTGGTRLHIALLGNLGQSSQQDVHPLLLLQPPDEPKQRLAGVHLTHMSNRASESLQSATGMEQFKLHWQDMSNAYMHKMKT